MSEPMNVQALLDSGEIPNAEAIQAFYYLRGYVHGVLKAGGDLNGPLHLEALRKWLRLEGL